MPITPAYKNAYNSGVYFLNVPITPTYKNAYNSSVLRTYNPGVWAKRAYCEDSLIVLISLQS